jgi:hypothetical protein
MVFIPISPEVADTIYESRKYLLTKHLIPYFSSKQIYLMGHLMISNRFYSFKIDVGYNPKTIKEMHSLLRRGFEQSIKWNLRQK